MGNDMSGASEWLWGPTYAEMRNPRMQDRTLRMKAAALHEPLNPLNLYNLRWHDARGAMQPLLIPPAVSGVEASIVVLDGGTFPSGSMKVGPAYAILMEKEIRDGIRPGQVQIIGPSTGNFGIGTAYVSRLKGYGARIVMPAGMSRERYDLIRSLGGTTDLTPGTESDVAVTLERTRARYGRRPGYAVLAQFEDMANYRFHRHVTGQAVQDAIAALDRPRVDAFVSAPGSAGTLGAGDALRRQWPDVVVAAVEPAECSTLSDGSGGQHVIEGIGDRMVTLIHNIFATDMVICVPGRQTLQGMELLRAPLDLMTAVMGLEPAEAATLQGKFGPSGICNLLGAVKLARHLGYTAAHTIVTVATDNYDRYHSVSQALAGRLGQVPGYGHLQRWHEDILALDGEQDMLSLHEPGQHERLQTMKRETWTGLGVAPAYIDGMRDPQFWEDEYAQIPDLDEAWESLRTTPSLS